MGRLPDHHNDDYRCNQSEPVLVCNVKPVRKMKKMHISQQHHKVVLLSLEKPVNCTSKLRDGSLFMHEISCSKTLTKKTHILCFIFINLVINVCISKYIIHILQEGMIPLWKSKRSFKNLIK